jgi:hypothetical protein
MHAYAHMQIASCLACMSCMPHDVQRRKSPMFSSCCLHVCLTYVLRAAALAHARLHFQGCTAQTDTCAGRAVGAFSLLSTGRAAHTACLHARSARSQCITNLNQPHFFLHRSLDFDDILDVDASPGGTDADNHVCA